MRLRWFASNVPGLLHMPNGFSRRGSSRPGTLLLHLEPWRRLLVKRCETMWNAPCEGDHDTLVVGSTRWCASGWNTGIFAQAVKIYEDIWRCMCHHFRRKDDLLFNLWWTSCWHRADCASRSAELFGSPDFSPSKDKLPIAASQACKLLTIGFEIISEMLQAQQSVQFVRLSAAPVQSGNGIGS